MDHCYCNINNKIWLLWDNIYDISIITDSDQLVSASIKGLYSVELAYISAIYAKCDSNLRKNLWDSIELLSKNINCPWTVFSDFKVITCAEKKKEGDLSILPIVLTLLTTWRTLDFKMQAILAPLLPGVTIGGLYLFGRDWTECLLMLNGFSALITLLLTTFLV